MNRHHHKFTFQNMPCFISWKLLTVKLIQVRSGHHYYCNRIVCFTLYLFCSKLVRNSESRYLQCWICSRWGAWCLCTFWSASWVCTCTCTFQSVDQHGRKYTEDHQQAESSPHYQVCTGHKNLQPAWSDGESHDTDGMHSQIWTSFSL